MTATIVLTCDHPMEGGTCAQEVSTGTCDLDRAIIEGRRQGWTVTLGGGAFCRLHGTAPGRHRR